MEQNKTLRDIIVTLCDENIFIKHETICKWKNVTDAEHVEFHALLDKLHGILTGFDIEEFNIIFS